MTTVVVLQPGYLPWLGFFDQLIRSDVFVYYDDVQYDKHSWRNRNRIKAPEGALWLTVPILNTGRHGQKILETEIDNRTAWARKHCKAIAQNYAKATFTKQYLPELEELLMRPWHLLIDLDVALVNLICSWLNINKEIVFSSNLNIQGEQTERLVNICQYFQADNYLSGDAAKDYLDTASFAKENITVSWQQYQHPVYTQLHGEFIPYLSIIDLIMNCGSDAIHLIL